MKVQNTLIVQSANIDNNHQSENLLKQMSRYSHTLTTKTTRELSWRQKVVVGNYSACFSLHRMASAWL